MHPLPSVESICGLLQQEEMQEEVLENFNINTGASALFSKGTDDKCSACGLKGHTKDKCWHVVGYPSWHPRSRNQSS